MKILIFILSITMAVPSWASLTSGFGPTAETNPGHGLPSGQCSYDQTNVEPAEPASVLKIRAEIKAKKDELDKLTSDLEKKKRSCQSCDDLVFDALKNLEGKGEESIKVYRRYLEGSPYCGGSEMLTSFNASNVDIYNMWSSTNGWGRIEPPRIINRSLAGGGGGERCFKRSTGQVFDTVNGDELGAGPDAEDYEPCPDHIGAEDKGCKYAGEFNEIRAVVCTEHYISNVSDRKKCVECLRKHSSYGNSKLRRCFEKIAGLEHRKTILTDELLVLRDELEYEESEGSSVVASSSGNGKGRKIFNSIAPILIGGGLGYLVGKAFYNKQKKAVLADDEIRKQQGYPIAGGSSVDSTGAIALGAAVGYGAFGLAKESGAFGCSDDTAISGLGSMFGGLGGEGGLGSLLSGVLGNGQTGINGQIGVGGPNGHLQNGGWVMGQNGQWVQQGGNTGMMTAAQIQAQMAQGNQQLAVLQQRQAALSQYASIQGSLAAEAQNSAARRAAIIGGVDMSALHGQVYGQNQTSGVMMPGMSGVLQGGVNLSVNAGASIMPPVGSFQMSGAAQTGVGTNFNPNVQPSPMTSPSPLRSL